MDLLKDKTVLITGASRGIGNGIARLFSQHGANIAFTYRSSAEQAKSLELDLILELHISSSINETMSLVFLSKNSPTFFLALFK